MKARICSLPAVVAIVLASTDGIGRAETPGQVPLNRLNCGSEALYTLLRLEGRPIELAALEAKLPAPKPTGYSMKELRDVAYDLGLGLSGVRLKKGEGTLDRPALAFVKRQGHGHFQVIRPIGHTGKLVQVIDPNEGPDVVDAVDLYASPDWTGLALIPDRPNWPARVAVFVGVCALALAARGVGRPRRSRRPSARAILPG